MFYLPIYVNNRRMHILHLINEDMNEAHTQLFHSFVMCSRDTYEVFSLPSSEAQLISDVLTEPNVDLRGQDFYLSKLDVSPYADRYPELPCYRFLIKSGAGNNHCETEKFYIDGYIGSDYTSMECFKVRANSSLQDTAYILQVCYEQHIQNDDGPETICYYSSAIRVYTYRNENELIISALDFGSEASQIKFRDDNETLNVREAFCELTKISKDEEHWQGRPSDDNEKKKLYKSIYHINTQPAPTFFGDLPMNNGRNTLIQTLLPVTHDDFSHLVLLPNLKLIELLGSDRDSVDVDFGNASNTNLIPRRKDSINNIELQNAILRQILCNFLAVAMYRKRVENEEKCQCLRFTILIPNVYYQQKVAKIIDGLYEDFDLLLTNHPDMFGCYRGIEVNMLSESDASYFGLMQQYHDVRNNAAMRGAYCLMIDAGKGTTDFSLLHQIGNQLSHYESIYRSGIPASGHVLTYAFYEALRDYFTSINRGAIFETIIRSAYTGGLKTKHLLDFVARLEEQKAHYGKYKKTMDKESENTARIVNNWDDLNGFLMELNTKGLLIPGAERHVNDKVAQMVQLLEASIEAYAKKHEITFLKVFLSGRAFKFLPFRNAVIESLIKNGLVQTAEQIDYTDRLAKIACMNGGIKEGDYTVNRKSTMLSVPSMQEIVGQVGSVRQFFRKIFGRDKVVMANIDFDFFYKGLIKGNVSNVEIDICGRGEMKSSPTAEEVYLYFVGDGYLFKSNTRCEPIDETNQSYRYGNDEEEMLMQLMNESLFPFDLRSMGYAPLTNVSQKALNAQLQEEKSASESSESSQEDASQGISDSHTKPEQGETNGEERTSRDNSPFGDII